MMTEATDAMYAGPWYVYHRDEDGAESDMIFYDYDKAQERFSELEDRGYFEALTLTCFPTPLQQDSEEDSEADGGCGCIIMVIVLIAVAIGMANGLRL